MPRTRASEVPTISPRFRAGSTALAGIVLVACLAALGPPTAGAAAGIVAKSASGEGARAYWTPARMRSAEPVSVNPAAPAALSDSLATPSAGKPSFVAPGAGAALRRGNVTAGRLPGLGGKVNRNEIHRPAAQRFRTHGKVFFTIEGGSDPGDFVCSGTSVNSKGKSLVMTAGHCVFDAQFNGGFATSWVFAPGYKRGRAPFGLWPAKELATTAGWRRENLKQDLGAATVRRNSAGKRLKQVVGADGIAFNQSRRRTIRAYGYPAAQPPLEFTGEREFRCTSKPAGTDIPGRGAGPRTTAIHCDMTAGSSGGGWMVGKTLFSVTSYGYTNNPYKLYGPYLGKAAKNLYRSVRKKRG